VCQCHRPPVMVEVPALHDVIDVWWVCLAAACGGQTPPARVRCHHHAPLSTLLLSAVHPVTLYTPSQEASHCREAVCAQRVQSGTTLRSPSALQRERRFLHTTVLVQQ
jgi:hypothetical protein